jgi:ABC-type iron transport system FetAB ATPase subunit
MTEAEKVGELLSDDWVDGLDQNSQEEIEAAILAFCLKVATIVEVMHGDAAVLKMSQKFRDAANSIDTRLAALIKQGEENMAKVYAA